MIMNNPIRRIQIKKMACLTQMGSIYQVSGRHKLAKKIFVKLKTLSEETGSNRYSQIAQRYLAWLLIRENKFEEALESFDDLIEFYQIFNNEQGYAFAMGEKGNAYSRLGQHDKAIEYVSKRLEIGLKTNHVINTISGYNDLASIHVQVGKFDTALEFAQKGMHHCKRTNYKRGLITINLLLSYIYENLGDLENAFKFACDSYRHAKECGKLDIQLAASLEISVFLKKKKDYEKALFYVNESLKIANELESAAVMLAGLIEKAEILSMMGELTEARRVLEEFLEL